MQEPLIQAWESLIKNREVESKWDIMDLARDLSPILEDHHQIRQILQARHAYCGGFTVPQSLDFGMHFASRALTAGIETALTEIDEFIHATHLDLQKVVTLVDTTAAVAFTFRNDVSIIRAQDVSPSLLARQLDEQSWGLFSENMVFAVLARPYRVEKSMLPLNVEPEKTPPAFSEDDDFTWTRLAISLIAPGGAPELFRQVSVPDRYGFLQRVFQRYLRMDLSPRPTYLEATDLTSIDQIIGEIDSFDEGQRPRLLILLHQFHRARLAFNQVQKAIHLRICIENMFVQDGEKEQLAAKVKFRGAPFLDVSKTAMERIYDNLSSAVHRGQLRSGTRDRPHEIEAFVQTAICQILEKGTYPNWSE
ncbi:hypothetical protein [Tritonibacter mobilis]|uniref:hypothetical protein n=1 Tax=Tritonibacter mobilis TaxID=379347 RepID=UPI001CD93AFC|nr:hypothetical protein [Tritonibacter mobilis]MCA2009798.1 hypothetical protein [Tritonibacter mobilis]